MSLQRPTVTLTIAGRDLGAPQAALSRLRLTLGVGRAHDQFIATAGPGSPLGDASAGDDAAIALGYGDSLTTVLTGQVVSVERNPWGVIVQGLAATAALSTTWVAQSYLQQTVGEIVQDLIGQANVDGGQIDASLKLFAYHIDERRSVWKHLGELARLASCEVCADAEGALNFRPPRAGPSAEHRLRHGADLIGWRVGPRTPVAPVPAVVPFGAASEQGSDKWHLVLRQPEGSSPSGPVLIPTAVRDRDGAQALADGLRRTAQRQALGGEVLAVGNPALRAGDLVELADMPNGEDGVVRALEVLHAFDGRTGYCTALRVEGTAP